MRTVTTGSVLASVQSRALLNTAGADTTTYASLLGLVADRLRTAWEFYRWPETMALQERAFRDAYNGATTYALAAEVYDATTNAYYSSAQGSNTGHAVTNTAWWTPLTAFHKYVSWTQTGKTAFDTVFECWDSDPRAHDDAMQVPFSVTDEGISFRQDAPTTVWLAFRKPAPNLDATLYDASTAYSVGQQVLWPATVGDITAEVYAIAIATSAGQTPLTHASKFTKIEFPAILARAVKAGALSDWYRGDGNSARAAELEGQEGDGSLGTYFGALEEQVRQLTTLQGQRGRYQFAPTPTAQIGGTAVLSNA